MPTKKKTPLCHECNGTCRKPYAHSPRPDLVYVPEDGAPRKLFVIKNRGQPEILWWAANQCGYRASLLEAGTYTEEQLRTCNIRDGEDLVMPLREALQEHISAANPDVLQAIAAMGGR